MESYNCEIARMLVEPHDFSETGRGLRCTRTVSKGEELLAVPLDDCWHAAGALRTAELAPLREAGASLTELDAIALHLLIERSKGEASARWAHLQEMPQAYDSTLFWSAEELEQLRGSAWLELAERFSEEVATDWTALQVQPGLPAILAEYAIGFADYRWAYATVKSRAAELRVGGVPTRLLAPRFDMFNHSDSLAPGSSHSFDEARQQLVAVAATAYGAGEQAFISYGPAPNGSLLLGGGFVLAHNRFDSVEVCVTAGCDARRLPLLMMVAPDAPPLEQEEASNFEFLQTPDLEELADGPRSFITRHLLTAQVQPPFCFRCRHLGTTTRVQRTSSLVCAGKGPHVAPCPVVPGPVVVQRRVTSERRGCSVRCRRPPPPSALAHSATPTPSRSRLRTRCPFHPLSWPTSAWSGSATSSSRHSSERLTRQAREEADAITA